MGTGGGVEGLEGVNGGLIKRGMKYDGICLSSLLEN
jgi:hypothetical protein